MIDQQSQRKSKNISHDFSHTQLMNMHRATVSKSINFGLMQSIFENKVRPKIKNLLNDSK